MIYKAPKSQKESGRISDYISRILMLQRRASSQLENRECTYDCF